MPETKTFTCVVCPRGCRLYVTIDGGSLTVAGNACPKGGPYARQEAVAPMRSLTSTVRALGGARPRLPVRTTGDIPLARMLEAMDALELVEARAPVAIGQVLAADFMGLGVDLVASEALPAAVGGGSGIAGSGGGA